jgi:hypothetical protein
VRVGSQQVITREIKALELNARQRTCFDVVVEDLAPGRLAVFLWGGSLRRF